jgi:hypothetical protein
VSPNLREFETKGIFNEYKFKQLMSGIKVNLFFLQLSDAQTEQIFEKMIICFIADNTPPTFLIDKGKIKLMTEKFQNYKTRYQQ